MKTVKKLGALVKITEPQQFGHLSNVEAGRLAKRLAPGSYDDYVDDELMEIHNPYIQKAQELIQHYDPYQGKFSSWVQGFKSESRTKLLKVISEEQKLLIEQAAQLEQAVIAGRKLPYEFQSFIAQYHFEMGQLRVQETLIMQALNEGYTHENWQIEKPKRDKFKRKQEKRRTKNELEIKLWKETVGSESANPVNKERELSNIKIRQYEEKARIELENEVKIAEGKLAFDMRSKHISRYMKIDLMQDEIEKQHIKISQIKISTTIPEDAKAGMIAGRQRIINKWMKEQDEIKE